MHSETQPIKPGRRLAYALSLLGATLVAGTLLVLGNSPGISPPSAVAAGLPDPAAPTAPDAIVAPEKAADGYWKIGFNYLADYDYQTPGATSFEPVKPVPGRMDGIPADIRALDGRPVRLEGYMMPLAMEKDGSVKEFLIMRSVLTCCYGATPSPTEWVVVKPGPKSAKVKPTMDVPLIFVGTLHVGELYRDSSFAGIYELDLDRVTNP